MIAGTGIDLVEIDRVRQLIGRHRALRHIFGEEELAELAVCGSVQSYAANFCAKEAFAKALGTGVRGFRLREVQLLREKSGRPYYSLSGRAKEIAERERLVFHVSITHTRQYAAAFAVSERTDLYENGDLRPDEGSRSLGD